MALFTLPEHFNIQFHYKRSWESQGGREKAWFTKLVVLKQRFLPRVRQLKLAKISQGSMGLTHTLSVTRELIVGS
jgi:hypothetical protein